MISDDTALYKITIALSTLTNSHPDILDQNLSTEIENSMKEIPTDRSVPLDQAVMDCLKLLKSKKGKDEEDMPNSQIVNENRLFMQLKRVVNALSNFRNTAVS